MVRRTWTRDELLVAYNLYCKIPFGRLHQNNPEIIKLASFLDRTPSAVAMKLVNFASLDPIQQQRGVRGLSNISRADRLIVEEFSSNWDQLSFESELTLERLQKSVQFEHKEINISKILEAPTENERLVRVRTVQTFFRNTVLTSYQYTCAMCGISVAKLLNASHIIPWKQDVKRRADPHNGLSLCALHDRAFDRGLVSVADDLSILVSSSLKKPTTSNVHRYAFHELHGMQLTRPNRFAPDRNALEFHRNNIFIDEIQAV